MVKLSLTKLQEKYSGMYVLTDKPGGRVIAASRNLKKAFKQAERKGHSRPAVQFVPSKGTIAIYEVKISIRN